MEKDSLITVFGANLKYFRELQEKKEGKKITQADIGALIGMSRQTYHGYEKVVSVEMTLESAEKIANRLGVKVEDLTNVMTPRETSLVSLAHNLKEANEEYWIVPKTILEDKYRIVPLTQIEEEARRAEKEYTERERNHVIYLEAMRTKDELIKTLNERIVELKSRITATPQNSQ
jgi:transcriptional regulator with XRE-family HTH domain